MGLLRLNEKASIGKERSKSVRAVCNSHNLEVYLSRTWRRRRFTLGGGRGITYRRRQLLSRGGINTHRRRHQHLPQEEEATNRHHHHTSGGAITHSLREGFYQFSDRLRVVLTLTHRPCYWESRVQSTTPHTTVALEVQQGPR